MAELLHSRNLPLACYTFSNMDAIDIKEEKNYILISINGELEQADAMQIRQLLDTFILEGRVRIAFQLIETQYLDSSILTTLTLKAKEAKKQSGYIAFVDIPPVCLETLQITKLAPYFDFVQSEEELANGGSILIGDVK